MIKKLLLLVPILLVLFTINTRAQCGSGATIDITESRCEATGTITVTGVTGIGPFTYDFVSYPVEYSYTGPAASSVITALNPGSYTLRIVDQGDANCFTDYPVFIPGNYTAPDYNITPTAVSGCYNGLNGSISGVLTSGRLPYSYEIIAGPMGIGTTNTTGTFTGLGAGTYTLRGYDSCGNFQTRQATIDNFFWSAYSPTVTKTGCGQYSFDAISISPSVPGVTYRVKDYAGAVIANSATLPITFSHPDNLVYASTVCAVDACGTESCVNFTINDWGFCGANSYYASCNTWTIDGVCISGSPIGPLTYGWVRAAGDTVWTSTEPTLGTPFTITKPSPLDFWWSSFVVRDACGVMKGEQNEIFLDLWSGQDIAFTSCTEATFSAYPSHSFQNPVTYSLNGGPSQSSGSFTNLTDGNYTITVTDACGETAEQTRFFDHNWEISGFSEPYCTFGEFNNYVSVNRRMKPPITYEQWDASYSSVLATQIWTDPNNMFSAWQNFNDWYSSMTFIGMPNTVYNYVATDDCGRKDTVTITNGPNGHVPNTLTTSVTPLCVNKGDITATYTSDNPTWNSIIISLWKTTNPGSPITLDYNTSQANGSYTWTNLDTGSYVIKIKNIYCSDSVIQTAVIKKYVQPKLRKSIAFNCIGGNVNCVGSVKGGLPPYQYEIFQTFPVDNPQPLQSSPIFTMSGTYSLIRMRVIDACGNSSIQDMAVRPPATPLIKVVQKLPVCNLSQLNLYVDSVYTAATYEWRNPAGTVIGTGPTLNLTVTTVDTGLYSCRVLISGTCYDDTTSYRLRPKDFSCLAKIGNYVWLDTDQDGVQDANEVGVAGVTVTLYDNSNNIVASTVTDAYGYYMFDQLTPGTYHAGFTLPSNYVFTGQDLGGNDLTDSDPNTISGLTGNVTLVAGDSNMSLDAGIYQPLPSTASLGDYVWNDLDQDGVQDANEPGISGVTVTLYDNIGNPIATTITDGNGAYNFSDLTPGTYSVGFSLPPGYVFTGQDLGGNDLADNDVNPLTGMTSQVTLSAGQNNPTIDAGMYAQAATTASLGNYVWNDVNNNGLQDANEAGVPGVTVTLYGSDGTTVIATTVTDEFGYYIFNNLTPGDYIVGFSNLPSGYVLTPQNAGGDDTNDSDPNTSTGLTGIINLSAGEKDMTVDAGIYNSALPLGAIGNYVWYDADQDGVQDANEVGTPGVTVTLYDASNTIIGITSTDANGFYIFNNLSAGDYTVGFSNLPPGYIFTTPDQGGNDLTDSDPNKGTGLTGIISLGAGQTNLTADAGIVWGGGRNGTASLGDIVWNDANNDGIQDPTELGVAGVTVTLYEADGITVIASTTTDALGNYLFTGLDAGSYVVGFSNLPAGYTFSAANQGSNDELDADADIASGGKTGIIGLATGEENLSIDAGIHQAPGLASIGNYVWNDLNQDGVQDGNEPGVSGVTVTLYNTLGVAIANTTTDANGAYQFTGLTPDTYYVEFTNLPAGFNFTGKDAGSDETVDSDADPINGSTDWVTLTAGQNYPDLDAGIYTEQAGLGNFVWEDINNNGIQDPGEPGIPGITVTLYAADGVTPIATTITNSNGAYSFVNLDPGTYVVGFSGIPAGASISPSNQGGNDGTDSDADPLTGKTGPITLGAGEYDPTIDAGINIPQGAGLGNYVWFDIDADGTQDPNEPGVAGVTVILYDATGNAIQSAITDENGFYSFPNLSPGTYSVGFTNLPPNRGFTTPNAGDDGTDSDVENITSGVGGFPTLGTTIPVTIIAGEYNPTLDAGLILQFPATASILQAEATLSGSVTKLNWITQDEKDVKSFDIQRSTDANSFVTITNQEAKGNTNGMTTYVINDNISAISEKPVIYYRVIMNDQDGQKSYSNTVYVKPLQQTDPIQIYPTPFKDKFTIAYPSTEESSVTVSLTDMLGKVIMTKQSTVTAGSNYITIDRLETLSIGSYFIKIIDDNSGEQFVKKIQKK